MTTTLTPKTETTQPTPAREKRPYQLTTFGQLKSEWTKFWSLRSVAIMMLLSAALPALMAFPIANSFTDMEGAQGVDVVFAPMSSISFGATLVGFLGVLIVTSEFSSGSIRSTMAANPSRLGFLRNKIITFTAIITVVFSLIVLTVWTIVQFQLADSPLASSISDPGVARALAGLVFCAVYWGLLGVALGTLVRNTAGAIVSFVVLFLMLPDLLSLVPGDWTTDLLPYLPAQTIMPLMNASTENQELGLTAAALLCGMWLVLLLSAGAAAMKRRDV